MKHKIARKDRKNKKVTKNKTINKNARVRPFLSVLL